ncbi:restriction endonuclease subunit S [Geomonas anaerohicana]|uniref:Restriction endonuclease subunit S n=1 Tax=Geomonas anaerohicana TaxID=2798583 RepID=A0ABS0YC44_9BACT|nr:restriction endonuclease subunit S [Geomonas anaerohicana]MBJ6749877.1 restriction endonuclease subunit S [Geomonas anaerohicana]
MIFNDNPQCSSYLSKLPTGWTWTVLDSLVDHNRGICYGIVQPGSHHADGVPMVNTGDVFDGHVNKLVSFKVAQSIHQKFKRSTLKGGELLITLVGANFGRVAIAPHTYAGFNCSRAVGVVPVNVDAQYVMFALRSPISRRFMDDHANTTAQPTFNLKDVAAIPIPLPPESERRRISEFLVDLDDRIALLRETNTTLESIAQAMFKSWFMDFDPVRAKQEGREPEGMEADTAALFPDSFEESELGLVPKGWRIDSIYAAAQVIYGAPFASSKFNSEGVGKPLIRIRDLKGETPRVFTQEVHPKGYLVKPGDIVVGMDGEFRAYLWGGEDAWLNQRVCVFTPSSEFPPAFVHRSIIPILAAVEASETATTVIHLGKNDIDRFRILVPDGEVLSAFGEITGPIYNKIVEQKQMARTLCGLRDTLLPRLISGQLRLPEAEALVEEAAA